MKNAIVVFGVLLASALPVLAVAGEHAGDPHYTDAGFFDVHVCNWPENPRFLMALFSTPRFDEVAGVSVFAPDGHLVGNLDLNRFRAFRTPSGQAKQAFITNFSLPDKPLDGWYRAEISLHNGSRFEAMDYVIHHFMAHPANTRPAPGATAVPAASVLSWDPIPGARFYEVFVRDEWTETEPHDSGLLSEPRYVPPPGLLQSGGQYVWRIHARDGNGNVLLGDFNHGSLSPEMRFTVK